MKKYQHLSVIEIPLLENLGYLVGKLLSPAIMYDDKRYKGFYLNVYDYHFKNPLQGQEWQNALEHDFLINPERLLTLPNKNSPCRLLGTTNLDSRDLEPKLFLSVPHSHAMATIGNQYEIIIKSKKYPFADVQHLNGPGLSGVTFALNMVSIEWVRKIGENPEKFFEDKDYAQNFDFKYAMSIVMSKPKYWETPLEIRGRLPY